MLNPDGLRVNDCFTSLARMKLMAGNVAVTTDGPEMVTVRLAAKNSITSASPLGSVVAETAS